MKKNIIAISPPYYIVLRRA